jgi:hypothetical protein
MSSLGRTRSLLGFGTTSSLSHKCQADRICRITTARTIAKLLAAIGGEVFSARGVAELGYDASQNARSRK